MSSDGAGVAKLAKADTRKRDTEPKRPFLALAFLLLAIGYSFLQGPVMAVELPEISRSLGISGSTGTLAATIMIAVSGATLIAWGKAADLVGRRKICLYGILVVLVASVLSAIAWNGPILVLARATQGLGTAMLLTSIGLVNVLFERSDRKDLAFGLLGASVGVGLTLAPLAAAGALALGSWRLSFWLNVPILLVAYVGIRSTVPESRDENAVAGTDWPGTILLALGVLTGLFALSQGSTLGWLHANGDAIAGWPLAISPTIILLVIAVTALLAFQRVEAMRLRQSLPVLMDGSLLRERRFGFGCLVSFLLVLGGYALQFTVPVFGRLVLDEDTWQVALLTAVSGVGITAGGLLAAPIGGRFGGRFVVAVGLAVAAGALALLTILLSDTLKVAGFSIMLLAFGIGYGLAYARSTEVVMAGVPAARVGLASGMLVAGRTCAMAIGSAGLTAIMLTNSDGAQSISPAELNASQMAFGLGVAILLAALLATFAIPRDKTSAGAGVNATVSDQRTRRRT